MDILINRIKILTMKGFNFFNHLDYNIQFKKLNQIKVILKFKNKTFQLYKTMNKF